MLTPWISYRKCQTILFLGTDTCSILSYEDSCTPASTLCWTAQDGQSLQREEQAGLLSQAVCLQRGCLVMEAPVHTLLCCCFCSTADASKGRQQPLAELHQQLPVPVQLFREAVAGVRVRMCKAGRGKAIEGISLKPQLCPGAQLLLSICLILKEPQLWHRSVYCCILGCIWKNAARRVREGITHFHV